MIPLLNCPFCGGEAAIEQTGKNELTLRCVGVQPSGLLGCGPKYVQKAGIRFTLEWLADRMTEKWNRRTPIEAGNGGDGHFPAPRGGVEPNWWEEWVKTTRAYNKLAKAAQDVIDETDRIHDSEPAPVKYRAPYGSITKMREILASTDRSSLVGHGWDGWLDISSAPKNQKVLVAYQNDLGNWRIVTDCYHTQLEWSDEYGDHEQEYAPEDWYEENDSSEVIYPTSRKPTHWQPLPAPPSIPSNEGREKA